MLSVVAAEAGAPLWDRLLVAAIGPLITVVIGGLVVWSVTSRIQHEREAKLKEREDARADLIRDQEAARADAQQEQAIRSRDDALRQELVTLMTEAAGSLYLMTQHYSRAKEGVAKAPNDPELVTVLQKLREHLDAQYLKSRTTGEILENRLEGYFLSREPRNRWHRVMDLLTVRYFQLIERDTDRIYEVNNGELHSGLDIPQLRDSETLLATYATALKESVRLVFNEDLHARSSSSDSP